MVIRFVKPLVKSKAVRVPDSHAACCNTGAEHDAAGVQLPQCLSCCEQHRSAAGREGTAEGVLGHQLCVVPLEHDLHRFL